MAHRFYIPTERISDDVVAFTSDQHKQIKNVLRLGAGDMVTVFDDSGREFSTQLTSTSAGRIIGVTSPAIESELHLTLVQSLPKGDKIDLILQKCTEIGVDEFLIMVTTRSIPKVDPEKIASRLHRWRSIVIEAAEQSGRVRLPKVNGIVSFKEALSQTSDVQVKLMAWEEEREHKFLHPDKARSMALFIGPEGGFSPEEAAEAVQNGVTPVTLGPRILRTETAAIVGSAWAIYGFEQTFPASSI